MAQEIEAIDPEIVDLLKAYTWRKGRGEDTINGLLRVEKIGDPEIKTSADIDTQGMAMMVTLATGGSVTFDPTSPEMIEVTIKGRAALKALANSGLSFPGSSDYLSGGNKVP